MKIVKLTGTGAVESDFIVLTLSTILVIQTFQSSVEVTGHGLTSGLVVTLRFDLSALNLYWTAAEGVCGSYF